MISFLLSMEWTYNSRINCWDFYFLSRTEKHQMAQTVMMAEYNSIFFIFQAALSNIHTAQLEMQKIAAEEFIEAYTGANTLQKLELDICLYKL